MALNNMKNNIGGISICCLRGCYLYWGLLRGGVQLSNVYTTTHHTPQTYPFLPFPVLPPPIPIRYVCRFFKTVGGGWGGTTTLLFLLGSSISHYCTLSLVK